MTTETDATPGPEVDLRNTRKPSTPLYGGLVALTVIASAVIVLTYTLLPLPGQEALGAWNYVAAVLCLVLTVIMVKRFRPAHFHEEPSSARPRVKASGR